MKLKAFLTILLALLIFSGGCATKKPQATFNRRAVYEVPPEGLWIPDALYDANPPKGEMKRTGPLWLPPGVMIGE